MNNKGIIQIHERDTQGKWKPAQGSTLTRFLQSNNSLSKTEKTRLVCEISSIMSKCSDPKVPRGRNTGLIIGHVQSGKTLSFTGLSALARDNGYQIVLLLAGTTNNLVEQSYERLKKDLEVHKSPNWKLFTTKDKNFQRAEIERVRSELSKWRKGNNRARTVLILSMKQHQHLNHLADSLAEIDLTDVPTLMIDDEGDQASMNTKAKQKAESTTYAKIATLRDLFPCHSYLMYTATPQAPLLVSRIDTLSPDFGFVLTPGDNYIGGKEFFVDGASKFIRRIPQSDVANKDDLPVSPPASLQDAMKDFFVGVAIGLLEEDYQKGANRSMMIHPAIAKADHLMFVRWARKIRNEWKVILDDPDHYGHEKLVDGFNKAFERLSETYSVNYGFDQIEPLMLDAVSETVVTELNTREKTKIPSIDWKGDYSWILVGGIGLDRGFTVEGLTVSYMPRSIGIGNSDNIQQRARFFGYKKSYLGLCRIYLTAENIDSFRDYVSHEESVRLSISNHIKDGGGLKDWRRTWFLNQPLKPTRSSVILLDMYQTRPRAGWVYPDYPYNDTDFVTNNREVVNQLLGKFEFWEYKRDGWNKQQTIPAFSDRILLEDIIRFIGQFRYKNPSDSLEHSAIMLGLTKLIGETPDMRCNVFAFSGPWSGVDAYRSLDTRKPPKIRNLFQGRNARTKFPGAREIRSDDTITFQIHRYNLLDTDKSQVLLEDVPVLAVYIPNHLVERVWVERVYDAI